VSDFIEWVPKHHGHQPLHWTPDMLTSVDGKSFVRQPNWAWIAGSVYYVPPEAVGMVREAVEEEPVVTDADRIEALTAENERLRTELLEWLDKTKWVRQTCQTHELGLHRADILRDRIEALTAALEAHENHMAAGQTLAVKYLVPEVDPDSIGKDEFVSHIIEHFDGPDQRAVQAKARAALEKQP
jgi:hypothetical protein